MPSANGLAATRAWIRRRAVEVRVTRGERRAEPGGRQIPPCRIAFTDPTLPSVLTVTGITSREAPCRIISRTVASPWDIFTNPGEIFHRLWQRSAAWSLLSARPLSPVLTTYKPDKRSPTCPMSGWR
jgi:hypothetical protein